MMDDTDFEAQTSWAGAGGHIPQEVPEVPRSVHWARRGSDELRAVRIAAGESLGEIFESRIPAWPI